MFDWLFWWAGLRWGDRVFVWLLGATATAQRRLGRLHGWSGASGRGPSPWPTSSRCRRR